MKPTTIKTVQIKTPIVRRPLGVITSSAPAPPTLVSNSAIAPVHLQTPEEEIAWLESLAAFLLQLLEKVEPNVEERVKYVSPEAMRIWARSFTHSSYNPNFTYETQEFLGDKALGHYFTEYVTNLFPDASEGVLNEFNRVYTENKANRTTAFRLGLTNYVRMVGLKEPTLAIAADLFESFIGGLHIVGELTLPGFGSLLCRNFLFDIFRSEGVDIDAQEKEGAYSTVLNQIFTRFDAPGRNGKLNAPELINNLGAGGESVSEIVLSKEHMQFLREQGKSLATPLIGKGVASSKKASEEKAYKAALQTLSLYGVNKTWAEETKELQALKGLETLMLSAEQRSNASGFTSIYLSEPTKMSTQGGKVIILYGVKENNGQDTHVPLWTAYVKSTGANVVKEAKRELLQSYINS